MGFVLASSFLMNISRCANLGERCGKVAGLAEPSRTVRISASESRNERLGHCRASELPALGRENNE